MTSDHDATAAPPGSGDGDAEAERPSCEVGYGKPPAHSRFRKGASGNPRGRKPASKNLANLLAQALDATVVVTEKGKRKKKSMRDVIVARLVHKSANADLKAIGMVLTLLDKVEIRTECERAVASDPNATNDDDIAVVEAFKTRLSNNGSIQ